jgi:ubiquinone/menaquinone biosynthesis C-methylase UbiE
MAAAYEELEPWYEHLYARLHAILREVLTPPPGLPRGRALDAGCGTGFQARLLHHLGYATHGVDISARLLAVAAGRLPGVAFTRASIEALPYADASFQAVSCCGSVLSFVEQPAPALAELARVLRPGGLLFLECEHKSHAAWLASSPRSAERTTSSPGPGCRAASRAVWWCWDAERTGPRRITEARGQVGWLYLITPWP